MLLALDRISHVYGPRLVFKDLSLSLAAGTVTLLAGANGSGKSTLLGVMAGLLRPCAGTVTRQEQAATGYLGHQTFLYPELSAAENLRFWSAMHRRRLSDEALSDILERVELAPFAEEKTAGFSRGMAQRLNLARVFLLQPRILLLDEPATGLDTRGTAVLHREIAASRAAGSAVVWITHSLQGDLARADKVALLHNKRLAFYGPASEYGESAP